MTTEHELAIETAKEIGKQVPVKQVYDDTTSPAAKQVGATLEDVVKCVRISGCIQSSKRTASAVAH